VVADFAHVFLAAAAVLVMLLSISPIRSIVDADILTQGQKVYWVVVVILFPVLGAVVWWFSSRTRD
jgi:hypothetical protein